MKTTISARYLIAVAKQVELDSAHSIFDFALEKVPGDAASWRFLTGAGAALTFDLRCIDAGNKNAATNTASLLLRSQPYDGAILVGMAGGVKQEVKMLDLVVAQCVVEAGGVKSSEDGLLLDGELPLTDAALRDAAALIHVASWKRHLPKRLRAKAEAGTRHVGPIFSSHKLVKSLNDEELKSARAFKRSILCADMDSAGFLSSAIAASTPAMVIRGISDLLENHGDKNNDQRQKDATSIAAAFAIELAAAETDRRLVRPTIQFSPPKRSVSEFIVGNAAKDFRAAAELGGRMTELTMYPPMVQGLSALLPQGFYVHSHATAGSVAKPDLSIVARDGGLVAHIEVKREQTLKDAFEAAEAGGMHQIARYRADALPVILTDAIRWFDVTDNDTLTRPRVSFSDSDATSDAASESQMRSWLFTLCGVKPSYTQDSAIAGMVGIIASINEADVSVLERGWEIVRKGLALAIDDNALDASGAGEIVGFTLLAIAAQLPRLNSQSFVADAKREWHSVSIHSDAEALPPLMGATLISFRDEDRRRSILGSEGWVTIRAIADWIKGPPPKPTANISLPTISGRESEWPRISALWDGYLTRSGRRKTLGSWQTPMPIAAYQVAEVESALQKLGYSGLDDDNVTVMDPSCGTGVYLDAVVAAAQKRGAPAVTFNSDDDRPSRLLGVDISSTAIAASHIRLMTSGATPALYTTDTLAAGSSSSSQTIFATTNSANVNPIVTAARADFLEVRAWASRSANENKPPVIAVIGNPPYLRSGLDVERYKDLGWLRDQFNSWRVGSRGGGSLQDLFVGFWAWAVNMCEQRHQDVAPKLLPGYHAPDALFDDGSRASLFGVVSFITNRTWIDGDSFAPMRYWLGSRAASIEITDFGTGTRGGGAGVWSKQPFAIETGTAIVTISFDPKRSPGEILYRRAIWNAGKVLVEAAETVERRIYPTSNPLKRANPPLAERSWVPTSNVPGLLDNLETLCGVRTGDNSRWVRASGDRKHSVRFAFRPFDNRWVQSSPPKRAPRNRPPHDDEAKPSSFWREKELFAPHREFVNNGGWYAVGPSSVANSQAGPALQATKHLPDNDLFNKRGARIIKVAPSTAPPEAFKEWANSLRLSGFDFWHYALAALNHRGYWTPGTPLAQQLADRRVQLTTTNDQTAVHQLVALGQELVSLWSLDTVKPTGFEKSPGAWRFDCADEAESIEVHGRLVLREWLQARSTKDQPLDAEQAMEYARSVTAPLRVSEIADEVAAVLG